MIQGGAGGVVAGDPSVVVDRAVTGQFEILGGASRWGIGIRLVECVDHAHAFHRFLLDSVDLLWCLDTGGFKDRRHDINDVMKLRANPADVFNMTGPGNGHPLSRAPEMRSDLLGPLERSIKRPCPCGRHMSVGLIRAPVVYNSISVRLREGSKCRYRQSSHWVCPGGCLRRWYRYRHRYR